MTSRMTKRELAKRLAVGVGRAYDEADKIGIPYQLRTSLRKDGNPFEYRIYLRSCVESALDEWARRQVAS